MRKAIRWLALAVILSASCVLTGLEVRYSTAQASIQQQTWQIEGNYTLIWPEPVISFNCTPAINIKGSATVDLNGHTITYYSGGKAPGEDGVVVEGKHGVTIKNGIITGFQIGIYVVDSTEVNVINNTLSDMADIGMFIEGMKMTTDNVTISGNAIFDIVRQGIWLRGVDHATVSGNTITNCDSNGIMIYNSSDCTIRGNFLSNTNKGIYADTCNGVAVNNNRLLENGRGVELKQSTSGIICHNDFVDNTDQVDVSGSNATWNYSYPWGGNYWSDYDGEDKLSGTNQSVLGSDGIGDQPYVIDQNNRDMAPLMNQWGTMLRVFDVTWSMSQSGATWKKLCPVAIFSNSSISDFNFSKKPGVVSFNVNNGTFCRAIIAKEVLEGAFNCSVDASPAGSNLTWDNTHVFVDLTYSNSSHKVAIMGERATWMPSDLNHDGTVNIIDITLVAKDYGKTVGP